MVILESVLRTLLSVTPGSAGLRTLSFRNHVHRGTGQPQTLQIMLSVPPAFKLSGPTRFDMTGLAATTIVINLKNIKHYSLITTSIATTTTTTTMTTTTITTTTTMATTVA